MIYLLWCDNNALYENNHVWVAAVSGDLAKIEKAKETCENWQNELMSQFGENEKFWDIEDFLQDSNWDFKLIQPPFGQVSMEFEYWHIEKFTYRIEAVVEL